MKAGVFNVDTPSTAEVVRLWPRPNPLAVVCGGGPAWGLTVVGSPVGTLRVDQDGSRWMGPGGETGPPFQTGNGPMADFRAALRWGRATATQGTGWMVSLSYELGEVIEPAVARRRPRTAPARWPLIELQRCETTLTFDHARREWTGSGTPLHPASPTTFALGELKSDTGRAAFEHAVARAIEYIRAGDAYQVNLAHRLSGRFSGSTREAFATLIDSANPWHGAYLELPDGDEHRALLSASPELFLRLDGRRVTARPMKGTWSGAADASNLRDSGKDRAELNMIIDLMRNDLGRVCRFGSVKVEDPRAIEKHGAATGSEGVWQGVGTVVGELSDGLDLVDLLAASFPPGSVTGAPKIRAMQIIDELEFSERGPYCGSIGWIGDDGRACLNVAIRTACIRGRPGPSLGEIAEGEISFSVGAGIVAESTASREWAETLEKAGVLGCLRNRQA
jgi:para-aminobenzoate synthetase component I